MKAELNNDRALKHWRRALIGVVTFTTSVASGQSFNGLGFLPAGGTESQARDVSNSGVVVGHGFIPPAPSPTTGYRGFRWTSGGGMENLGTLPGGAYSVGRAVSVDGSVIAGWSGTPTYTHAIRLTGGVMTDLGFHPSYAFSAAEGISDNGSVVVGRNYSNNNFYRAFRWNGGVMTDLGTLSGYVTSTAQGVSGNGAVVVGYAAKSAVNTNRAFRWTNGSMTSLGTLKQGAFSEATDASTNGSVVVGTSDSNTGLRAFRWTGNKMTSLGTLPGQPNSYGQAVSGDGSMVVGYASDGSVQTLPSGTGLNTGHAFLWTQTLGMVDLNTYLPTLGNIDLSGWDLRKAQGISPDGSTIVGWGLHNGAPEAWIASLSVARGAVPEPAAGLAMALLAGVTLYRRRSR